MKAKFFIATLLIAGASLSMMAQGYKDGIEFYKIADYENARVLLERETVEGDVVKALLDNTWTDDPMPAVPEV